MFKSVAISWIVIKSGTQDETKRFGNTVNVAHEEVIVIFIIERKTSRLITWQHIVYQKDPEIIQKDNKNTKQNTSVYCKKEMRG